MINVVEMIKDESTEGCTRHFEALGCKAGHRLSPAQATKADD